MAIAQHGDNIDQNLSVSVAYRYDQGDKKGPVTGAPGYDIQAIFSSAKLATAELGMGEQGGYNRVAHADIGNLLVREDGLEFFL
jgi:hypothetical protein